MVYSPNLRYYPGILLEEERKTAKSGAEIGTHDLKLQIYHDIQWRYEVQSNIYC